MTKRLSGRIGLALMAFGLCGVATSAQEGKGLWGVKPLPWKAVQRKADFPILTPKAPDGQYTLVKSEIAWVQKHEYYNKDGQLIRLPARRIVCLFYKIREKGIAAVLEAKTLPVKAEDASVATDPYVYQAFGQGYFFDKFRVGTKLVRHQRRGIAFMVVTRESIEEAEALSDALLARSQE